MSSEYDLWASAQYPYDIAECGRCLSGHGYEGCVHKDHAALRSAAKKEKLVKLVNRLRTGIERDKQEIRKTFLKLRKKYKRFWKK